MAKLLTEFDSRKLLQKYKIPVPKAALAKTKDEARKAADAIGYPVVMKVMSQDILHKTEANIVRTFVFSSDIEAVFQTLLENARKYKPSARVEGILVEETVNGSEVMIGGKFDAQFGPVVLFGGLGGVLVELLKDVSFRVAPFSYTEAIDMIRETKGSQLLAGFRGMQKDVDAVADVLVKVSELVAKEDIAELDINPLFVKEKGCVAADVRIVLKE